MEGSYAFNIYSLALVFCSVPAFALAIWIGINRNKTLFNWYSLLLFAAAVWSAAYGFELASSSLEQMLFWIKIEYIGICALPSLWLIFCFNFIGREHWVNPYTLGVFILYSLSTYVAVYTNADHNIFYSSTRVDLSSAPFPLLALEPGPWYKLHTLIFYIMIVWGYVSLFFYLGSSRAIYRKQNAIIIFSTLLPLLVNIGYVFFDLRPYKHIDLTPFAFLGTSFIMAMGLLKVGLFDLMPIARSKVINQMDDGFVLLDEQGRISDFNDSFLSLIEREEAELLAKSLDELFRQPISAAPQDASDLLEYQGQFYELSRVEISHGAKVVGQSILFKNVSERMFSEMKLKEQRLELEKLNVLKDRLFSIIAHDLRGPLHNLQEVLSLIHANVLSDEEKEYLLVELSRSVDQSVGLMENLLSWASSQQKGEKLKPEGFRINELVEEVLNSIKALVEKKDLNLKFGLEEDLKVLADREMIRIVLRNLIGNAIKFSHKGGTISIKSQQDDGLIISISDEGVGMPPEVLKQLFSIDLQSRKGTLKEEGSGLGLILCKDFIDKNSGHLKVESEEGQGSTFSFTLPIAP